MDYLRLIIDALFIGGIWWEIYDALKCMTNLGDTVSTIYQTEYVLVDFDKSTVTYKRLPAEYKENIKIGTQALLAAILILISFFMEIIIDTDTDVFTLTFTRIISSVPLGLICAWIIGLLSRIISRSIIKLVGRYAEAKGITRKISDNTTVI